MLKKSLKNQKGFTLIELIVIIAMLGILMAIAVPSFIGFTNRANKSNDDALAAIVENGLLVNFADSTFTLTGPVTVTITDTGAATGLIYTPTGTGTINMDVAGTSTALTATTLKTELDKIVGSNSRMKFYDNIVITITPGANRNAPTISSVGTEPTTP